MAADGLRVLDRRVIRPDHAWRAEDNSSLPLTARLAG
jgi:hypothetical protein